MKEEFHEEYTNEQHDPLYEAAGRVNPLYETTIDFDLAEVERRLGEASEEPDYESLGKLVHRLFRWVAGVEIGRAKAEAMVGRRFLAMAWVTNPDLFSGSPSASKLAETLGIRRKADFWELTGEASRALGITNRSQKHAWNRR
ncbi:MAG: hypothetical protein ACREFR_02255 [Limisphaerales bacterium]